MSFIFSSQAKWRLDKEDPTVIRCGDEKVAEVFACEDDDWPEYSKEANGRLVAAAPQLYRYLDSLTVLIHHYFDHPTDKMKDHITNMLDYIGDMMLRMHVTYNSQRYFEAYGLPEENQHGRSERQEHV